MRTRRRHGGLSSSRSPSSPHRWRLSRRSMCGWSEWTVARHGPKRHDSSRRDAHSPVQVDHDDAIARFRSAVGLVRDRPAYRIALSQALMAAGRNAEAKVVAEEVLQREATSGDANLTMARILARTGEPANAVVYYQRAALGHWPDAASGRSGTTRAGRAPGRNGPTEHSWRSCWPCNGVHSSPAPSGAWRSCI